MEISEVFRKLKPLLGEAELARLREDYLAADLETRRLLEASLRLEAARTSRSSFEEREILLGSGKRKRDLCGGLKRDPLLMEGLGIGERPPSPREEGGRLLPYTLGVSRPTKASSRRRSAS